jgi:hypothetical protein
MPSTRKDKFLGQSPKEEYPKPFLGCGGPDCRMISDYGGIMNRVSVKLLISVLFLVLLFVAKEGVAADKLPLKHGLYVIKGVSPLDENIPGLYPAFAVLTYNGQSFTSSYAKMDIIDMRADGNIYYVTLKWTSLGSRGSKAGVTGTVKWTITVYNRTSFIISEYQSGDVLVEKDETTYHWVKD